jgi:hypothetical protein
MEALTASTAASGRKLREVFAVKHSSEMRNPAKLNRIATTTRDCMIYLEDNT